MLKTHQLIRVAKQENRFKRRNPSQAVHFHRILSLNKSIFITVNRSQDANSPNYLDQRFGDNESYDWLALAVGKTHELCPYLDIVYDGCDYDDGCQERDPDELNGLEERKKRQS